MVEFGNSLDPDEEFDVLLGILDFPMECLEGDEVAEDWDISNAQFLGPIPSNVLMEPPMTSNEEFNAPNLFPRPVAPIAAALKLKQLPENVDTSSLRIPRQRKFAKVQESGSFRTQSPVSVLESSGSCSREKSLSIKSDHSIPARSRSKRVRYSGVNPWLLAAHELSTSKWTSSTRGNKESRKRLFQQPIAMELMRNSPENVDNSLTVSEPAHQVSSKPRNAVVKKCAHCQSTKTPQWREGPLGPKTLCNACGVRYRSGRLFPEYRPATSPTFVPSQHSNSHRKVVEMRNEAKRLKVNIKIVGAPEQKQLTKHVERMQLAKNVDTSSSHHISGAPKQKLPAKYDDDPYRSHIPLQNKLAKVQESESVAFCAENRVSLLQSSRSSKYRSKYIEIAGVNPWLPPPPCKNASNAMRCKESREKLFQVPVVVDVMKNSPKNDNTSLDFTDPARLQNASNSSCPAVVKKCAHCQSTKTPQWREGPLGPRTLCNACGIRYRSGRLVPEYRPAASPTFVPSQHSNSHRNLMQMRTEEAMQLTDADIKVVLTSPQPDFVPRVSDS